MAKIRYDNKIECKLADVEVANLQYCAAIFSVNDARNFLGIVVDHLEQKINFFFAWFDFNEQTFCCIYFCITHFNAELYFSKSISHAFLAPENQSKMSNLGVTYTAADFLASLTPSIITKINYKPLTQSSRLYLPEHIQLPCMTFDSTKIFHGTVRLEMRIWAGRPEISQRACLCSQLPKGSVGESRNGIIFEAVLFGDERAGRMWNDLPDVPGK